MTKHKEESESLLSSEHEKRGYYNVIILGISFCILFVSFSACQNLQTNLNKDLGFLSLSVLYSVFAPANFISPYVVLLFGEKISLMFGAACYCVFIAANIKVKEPTLLGASAIIGFGAAVLWTAQGSTVIHNATPEKLGAFNGLFFGIFQWSQVIGNLLVGVLLSRGISNFWLFSVLTIIAATSIIGFLFLRPPQAHMKKEEEKKVSMTQRLKETFATMGTKQMALLYMAMIYSGVSQTYMFGVFPGTLPKNEVGYIMAVFGAADVLGSFVAGYMSDKVGRLAIVFTCALSMSAAAITFYLEDIHMITDARYLSYIIAILLGIADSGFNTQIYATLGVVFHDRVESAIGAFKFFQAGSTAVLFFLGTHVGHTFYFITVLITLWSGTLGFFVLDAITPKVVKVEGGINA